MKNLRDIYGIDGAHFKDLKCFDNMGAGDMLMEKFIVVAITGRTSNNNQILLGFAIGTSESNDLLKLLFDTFIDAGIDINKKEYTFIYDRGSALLSSVPSCLPLVSINHCPKHLERNIQNWGLKTKENLKLFWAIRNCVVTSKSDYLFHIVLKKKSPRLYEKLKDIENWRICHLIDKGNYIILKLIHISIAFYSIYIFNYCIFFFYNKIL